MPLLYCFYAVLFTALLFVPLRAFRSPDEASKPAAGRAPWPSSPALDPGRYPIQSVIALRPAAEPLSDATSSRPAAATPKVKVWPLKAAEAAPSKRPLGRPLKPREAGPRRPMAEAAKPPDTARFRAAERLFRYENFKGALGYYQASLEEGAGVLSPAEERFIRRRMRDCRRELAK